MTIIVKLAYTYINSHKTFPVLSYVICLGWWKGRRFLSYEVCKYFNLGIRLRRTFTLLSKINCFECREGVFTQDLTLSYKNGCQDHDDRTLRLSSPTSPDPQV